MTTTIERIADWSASLRFEDVPDRIVAKAKLQLLSMMAAIYAGFPTRAARAIREVILSTRANGRATVFPQGDRSSPTVAVVARTEDEGQAKLPGNIHQTVAEIREAGGEAIAIRTDITEQKHATEEVAMARERELTFGFQIQQTLLVGKLPQRLGPVSLAAYIEPSAGIDGDFYEFTQHSETLFDVAVGDVLVLLANWTR